MSFAHRWCGALPHEMSDNLTEQESQALNRDIGQLEALIEELLTYARLDRPQNELKLSVPDLPMWLTTHLEDVQSVNPDRAVRLRHLQIGDYGALDMRLMERVLDNLLNNALRYCQSTVQASLQLNGSQATLIVEDDGPGIAPAAREQILNRSFVWIPAVTGRQVAADLASPSSTPLLWLWAVLWPVMKVNSAVPASP